MTEKTLEKSKKRIILPIYDFSFKAIFERNDTDVVAGFLKSILSIPEEEYEEITFDNPHLYGRTDEDKQCIVDLLLHTKSQNIIHIEMQVVDKLNFVERSIFYNSQILTRQLKSGDKYDKLKKNNFNNCYKFFALRTFVRIFEKSEFKI